MVARGIHVSVLHFDCFWMKAHTWTSFTFDPKYFPNAKTFLTRLHERGVRVCVWINSYIAQESDVFDEAINKGYLIKRRNGSVWQSDTWQAGMGIVDFTNPEATQWYKSHLLKLLDLGVSTFKTDFGERIPFEDIIFHNGMDPRAGHNYYSILYNTAVYSALVEKRGVHDAVLFARAASAGGQRLPVHWGGDCESTWNGMAQSLRGGLSVGLSGFAFWSHDIAGYMSEGNAATTPAAAIYKRWVQFGLLSSHSRLHGSTTYRVPWLVDGEASAVLSRFTRLKNQLMPYIFGQAVEAHRTGLPLLRAMVLEFPEDRTCQVLDEQYMLGDSLLVAPIFNEHGTIEYYVPSGRWKGLIDGRLRVGPSWVKETHGFMQLPLLLREDRVLLLGTDERPDYDWGSNLTRAVIGAVSPGIKGNILEAMVPSAKNIGEWEGSIRVAVPAEDRGSFAAERSGQAVAAAPAVLVLSENAHL